MVSKKSKAVGLLLTTAMTMSLVSACGSSNDTSTAGNTSTDTKTNNETASNEGTETTGIDTSKKVELQFYMLGNAPKDLSKVEAEINKMALEDLNATVKFNYTTWTDWDQKYKLLLSTGQNVDLIFTADWTQYQQYAKKGAFLALDDLLPKAAPTLQAYVPQDMWDAVKIDGKIYTVPSTYKEYVTNGFVWREDLRKKYDLPTPVDMKTFEAYLEGIKQNEPKLQPVSFGPDILNSLVGTYLDVQRKNVGALPYGLYASYDKPSEMTSYWGSADQLADLKLFKSWVDKGYFSKNELNETESMQDKIANGTAAAILGDNPTRYNATASKMKSLHPDWELGYTPFGVTNGYATPVHPIHNGFAIPNSSKHADRALAFYEKLVTDKRYNLLTEYGIEGVNYTVEDGYYKMLGDANTNGFAREAMNGWAWRNPEFMLFEPSYDGVKAIFDELDKIQKPDIFTGFAEDYTEYQSERAALEQVVKQYLQPIVAGQVDDLEGQLQKFMDKANQAGLQKIQEAYKKQWLAYLSEKGIQ
ncbi:putative aldouronate transport system substrate-binding protein [Paenibacillus cellulosilyticus]|uniref:Putative aldouronate transport system substrate-binding protein n=2 Tax=Paenibacillus cellulosilyticus TaxID=375489 RepID=A0A2V2YS48_9BACL|nr:extracellular solute-binding protein [Paenibacillus cellulosilyticus]PWW00974.1 putative aldouronate transport system substrate-binding protein [Paenibacillus cellulosilyticus]QKS47618.1 extracellular solute-binding protein [Paenibacillus cellulosilyticus]